MEFMMAFLIGGAICALGQLFIDLTRTSVTPAHVLVGYVVCGAILSALGLYQPLVELAGAGATIPLCGFGHSLVQGVIKGVQTKGLLGVFAGGIEATATGIVAAVVFGFAAAVFFNPRS